MTPSWRLGALTLASVLLPRLVPAAEQLSEITVTATKRGEQLTQDVPAAIQALSGDSLQKIGAVEFSDYAGKIPSLSFTDLGPGDKKYVIRGITSTGAATVGVYYDETVITASNANDGGGRNADIRLFDLDRVEVLKGPQGTLYGASSMSGTIRYITKKPDLHAFGGYVNAEVSDTTKGGTNIGVNGALNLPIVDDKLAARFTGWDIHNSGFIDAVRIPAGPIKDANKERTRAARVHLRWQPTDNLNLLLSVTNQSLHTDGSNRYTPAGTMSFGDVAAGYPSIPGGDLVNTDLTQSPWDETLSTYSLTAEWKGSSGTLTATGNYFDRRINFLFDSSPILFYFGVPIPGITIEPQERRVSSYELRYASALTGPVNFVAGAFAQNEHNDLTVQVMKSNAFGFQTAPFSPLDSDDALQHANGNTFFGRTDYRQLKQYAAFGEVTWQISPKWSAIGGLRYFHSKQDAENETTHPFGGFGTDIPVGVQTNSGSGNKTTFKASLSYKYSDDGLLYATVSQGFRVGGVNAANLPFASGIQPTYRPDTLTNYELGAKNEFLDHRLRLNAAIYQINWKDIQVQALDTTGAFRYITNAGTARSRGVELEAQALLAPGLEFDFGGSWTDAKLTEDHPNVAHPELHDDYAGHNGDRLPNVPRIQFNAALSYKFPVSSEANLDLIADVNYRGSTDTQFRTSPALTVPNGFNIPLAAYTLVNLRAAFDWHDWTATLFAKNLTDKRAQVDGIAAAQDPYGLITVRPRTIGVSVTRKF